MDPQTLMAGFVRGLARLSLAAAIGGLVLEALALGQSPRQARWWEDRLRRWITLSLAVLALTTLAELVVRTQVMTRASMAVALAAVPDVVTGTHFGAIVGASVAAAILAGLLSITRVPVLRALCLLLALGIALSVSLTGHAADWGDLTVSVAVDWLHVVAVSAWTGGLVAVALVVLRGHSARPLEPLTILVRRFSRLAGVCLVMVLLTGGYNAWAQLGALSRLWTTAYGGLLIVKVTLVCALILLGAANRYLVVSRLGSMRAAGVGARLFRLSRLAVLGPRRSRPAGSGLSLLVTYVRREALLVVGVFACTAALGEATPGRHVSFERKPTSHVTPAVPRVTDGGPRLGTVTPPAGNADRGRAVFVKLECFTCHLVQGEGFAPPTRPGPDLSGIGRRHPGYLVESIMNPDAMIVDGPGFTDARGLSLMPDYRERLTVSELIDLVAYLKTRT